MQEPALTPYAFESYTSAEATTFGFDGAAPTALARAVAIETPVNLVYGTVPYAVMMATPDDLVDFAAGFSLTEGIIQSRADIRGTTVRSGPDGIVLSVDLVPERFHGLLARRRAMAGRTGCGVCGIEDLALLPRSRVSAGAATRIRLDAIRRALGALTTSQALNRATHAVHAAAWATLDGSVVCVREDVGRHNALDKLIGALLASAADPAQGFLVITSRCSYEMVEKAAAFGAGALVAISAPTALGVERASEHGILLAAIARSDAVTVFVGADRIVVDQQAPTPVDGPVQAPVQAARHSPVTAWAQA